MSKKAQHTPGPWKAQGCQVIQAGKMEAWQFKVAILPTTIDPKPTFDAAAKNIAERDANAHLIAAAPELLAALEKAVERQGFTNEELIDARAVIAKAKGTL